MAEFKFYFNRLVLIVGTQAFTMKYQNFKDKIILTHDGADCSDTESLESFQFFTPGDSIEQKAQKITSDEYQRRMFNLLTGFGIEFLRPDGVVRRWSGGRSVEEKPLWWMGLNSDGPILCNNSGQTYAIRIRGNNVSMGTNIGYVEPKYKVEEVLLTPDGKAVTEFWRIVNAVAFNMKLIETLTAEYGKIVIDMTNMKLRAYKKAQYYSSVWEE